MKITSMDVHRKEFGTSMRGYREDEVDDFLDAVAAELDRLNAQIESLAERAKQSESQALNFEAERNTINNALLTAQRASDDVLEQAKEQAKELLDDADERASKMLTKAKQERDAVLDELDRLKVTEEEFRTSIIAHAKEIAGSVKTIKPSFTPKPSKTVERAEEEFSTVEGRRKAVSDAKKENIDPPKIKREKGIGQYGEMEDDLETID